MGIPPSDRFAGCMGAGETVAAARTHRSATVGLSARAATSTQTGLPLFGVARRPFAIVTCIHGTWARGSRWPDVEKAVTGGIARTRWAYRVQVLRVVSCTVLSSLLLREPVVFTLGRRESRLRWPDARCDGAGGPLAARSVTSLDPLSLLARSRNLDRPDLRRDSRPQRQHKCTAR